MGLLALSTYWDYIFVDYFLRELGLLVGFPC